MRQSLLLLCGLLAIVLVTGCTAQQREDAQLLLADLTKKLHLAEQGLAIAQDAAKTLDAEKGAALIANAQLGVELTQLGVAKATEYVAKLEQGSWKTALASAVSTAVALFIPFIGAVRSGIGWKTAAIQTFRGLQSARVALGDDAWKAHVAPALGDAQDTGVKARVKAVTG